MNRLELLEETNKQIEKFTKVIEIYNMYVSRNEDPKACLKMIGEVIYGRLV